MKTLALGHEIFSTEELNKWSVKRLWRLYLAYRNYYRKAHPVRYKLFTATEQQKKNREEYFIFRQHVKDIYRIASIKLKQ